MHIVYSSENYNVTTVYHTYKSMIRTINVIILDSERGDECIDLQSCRFFLCPTSRL